MNQRVLPVLAFGAAALLGACRSSHKEDAQNAATPAANAPVQSSASLAAASPSEAKSSLLAVGASAPEIQGVAHNGQAVKLSALRGRPVVIYFYPKDDTPGCTVEAEGFRDDWQKLLPHNVVVIGVSADDNESHKAFAEKHQLPFLLLPDSDHAIANAFGVPVNMAGRAKRVTFVIDKDGKVARVFPDVTPKGHAAEILQVVSTLRG